MRVGMGLHLWSQGDYFLEKQLDKELSAENAEFIEAATEALEDGDATDSGA